MTPTEEILKEVESLAYRYMSIDEIALITGVPVGDIADGETPTGTAFLRGRLMRKAEFNESLIQLSKQLSSPAMMMENKLAESTRINDLKHETHR